MVAPAVVDAGATGNENAARDIIAYYQSCAVQQQWRLSPTETVVRSLVTVVKSACLYTNNSLRNVAKALSVATADDTGLPREVTALSSKREGNNDMRTKKNLSIISTARTCAICLEDEAGCPNSRLSRGPRCYHVHLLL